MSQTTFDHENWEAGSEQTTTTSSKIKAGLTLAKRTPMGIKKSSGEFAAWDPAASDGTEVATRITPFEIDTTAGASEKQLIKGGIFNPELINWPAGITDVQKLTAFVGTPISLQTLY